MPDDLALLHALARDTAHTGAPARDAGHAGTSPARPGTVCSCVTAVLADRVDGTVVRHGAVVVKAHAPGTVPAEHILRTAVAAHPDTDGVLLRPLPFPGRTVAGRALTAWPYGGPVDPADPDAAPWEEAARLLARLHATVPPYPLPAMRAPAKAALAVDRMRRSGAPAPAVDAVLRAWRTVPEAITDTGHLCHGDFHLGQLVRDPAVGGRWLLIDVDDLGRGDPAWDLARPAAWYAAGLLPPDVWSRFLDAYRTAGGPAVTPPPSVPPARRPVAVTPPTTGDPWERLDVPARALTVQTAALALAKSTAEGRPLDEVEEVIIDTCSRIGTFRTELAPPAST
ncbi:phosphotransferase enzyme family protein [Streptomyces sp. NBC_01216]|uniref:phosphotransferase enzyme family protein n=1 Tax=Streptomyces sp. NBC_01216 TaxID=2903778 RepID=UPI003FA3B4CA